MKRARFLMVGGFLGAGKTTAIARLARHYVEQGLRVGVVTNDQAYDLVDTQSLRAQGFQVGEVPGACFCCKFNDLVETAAGLTVDDAPDIIIAEPVGSCTDLVATVVEPLRHLYDEQYEIAPLAVLLKPEHGQKILREQPGLGFSPKAAYIFLKQVEEADVVVINKIDKLSAAEISELVELVRRRFPGKTVLAASARHGDGFAELISAVEAPGTRRQRLMEVDYDVYAEGEAELGWLNCSVAVASDAAYFVLDDLLLALMMRLQSALVEEAAEAAHLKIFAEAEGATAVANLVGTDVAPEISLAADIKTSAADLVVNARVAMAPDALEQLVLLSIEAVCSQRGLSHEVRGMQRFRPGRPIPTHRMTST